MIGVQPSYSFDGNFLQETIQSLIKSGRVAGSIKAGSFVPSRYESQKVGGGPECSVD